MALMAPLIPIMYFDSMTDVMLKGLGQQFYSMIVNIADSLLSVISVWLLIPKFGILGYILIIYVCEIINTSLSVFKLIRISKLKIDFINWIAKPIFAVIGAICITRIISAIIITHYTILLLCFAIFITILVYLILLVGLFAILPNEIKINKNNI